MRKLACVFLVVFILTSVSILANDRPIPRKARIFIDPMPNDFHTYLKEAITREHVPVIVLKDARDADYLLASTGRGRSKEFWQEGRSAAPVDNAAGTVDLVHKSGRLIWTSKAGGPPVWFPDYLGGGERKLAERIAENMKRAVSTYVSSNAAALMPNTDWWGDPNARRREAEPESKPVEVVTLPPRAEDSPTADRSQAVEGSTFRSTRWGMTREQVIANEGGDIINEDQDRFLYKRNVIGRDVHVAYYFSDHRLVRARYALEKHYADNNDYLTDFNAFKDVLQERYGDPVEDSHEWKGEEYAESEWGEAIVAGHLTLIASWKTPETKILMNMLGDGTRINLVIEYRENQDTENVF